MQNNITQTESASEARLIVALSELPKRRGKNRAEALSAVIDALRTHTIERGTFTRQQLRGYIARALRTAHRNTALKSANAIIAFLLLHQSIEARRERRTIYAFYNVASFSIERYTREPFIMRECVTNSHKSVKRVPIVTHNTVYTWR